MIYTTDILTDIAEKKHNYKFLYVADATKAQMPKVF